MPPDVHNLELRRLAAAAQGDQTARHALFEQHRDAAYAVAYRITGRAEDAMDVVQDSFISAFEKLSSFNREAGFRTWLLRIVSNRALDLLRARKVRLAVPLDAGDEDRAATQIAAAGDDHSVSAPLEQSELAERLQRAISALPDDQRAVFALYATGDMTYGEIADALDIPVGTVMSRLYHARRRLRERLPDVAPGTEREE